MPNPSPDHSLLVNESLRQRFESSWMAGTPEPLSECLPGTDTDEFGPTLEELIHIQLEFAWKAYTADGERIVSVQALLEKYPILGDDAVLLRLLRQEFHCRETAGDSPSVDDYRRAFPDLNLEHLTTPPGETIGPRASDDTATGVATADQTTLPPPGTSPPAPLSDQVTLDAPVAATHPADEQTLAPPAGEEKPSSIQDDATFGGGTPGVVIDVDNSSDTVNTDSSDSSAPVDLGKQVPGYELLGELGRGGMGVVYRALDTRLKRVVALKMILSGVHADEEDLERFQGEAEAVAQLQHPNIVQIHDVGEHDGQPFLSLEFVEGGGLDEKIGGEPQPPREATALVETLARAVHFAHERNIVHRDLKPANVLLTGEGEPKITDFGLAKRLEDDASQTASGSIMGTPSYMAPEQAGDKKATIGPQTDVYALGAILYCLLTGRPPFQSSSAMDTVMQVLEQEPLSPRQLVPGLDRNLETIALKCLQKSPERRYQSAEEVAEELRRYQVGEPIQARPVGRVERVWRWARRNPAVAILTVVLVFYYVLLQLMIVTSDQERDEQRELTEKQVAIALDAIDGLTKVSEDERLSVPEMEPVRRELLQKSRIFYEKFVEQASDDPLLTVQLWDVHLRLGRILSDLGDPAAAIEEYQKYHDICVQLTRDHPGRPAATMLAKSHSLLGDTHYGLGNLDEAVDAYREATVVRERLAKDFPDDLRNIMLLTVSFHDLGIALGDLGKHNDAIAAFNELFAIRKQLVKDDPANPAHAYGLAFSYADLGSAHNNLGKPIESLKNYNKAITIQEQLVKGHPDNSAFTSALSSTCYKLGSISAASGEHAETVKVAERLARLNVPGKQPGASPSNLYKAAGLLSLASGAVTKDADLAKAKRTQLAEKYATRAMELLRDARNTGWFQEANNVSHLKDSDRDIDPLRQRDDFKAFLRELEAKPTKLEMSMSFVPVSPHLAV